MQINLQKDGSGKIKKRILMIAYYFPPLASAGTLRTLKYVKYLPVLGWQPHILTVQNAHHLTFDSKLESQIPEEAFIYKTKAFLPARFFRKKLNHTIDYTNATKRQKSKSSKSFDFFKKLIYTFFFCPDEFAGWFPFALIRGLKIIGRNKQIVLYSTAPPNTTQLIAYFLKKITGKSWIADFRDLWDQYPESYNPFGLKWKKNLDNYLEHLVLENADRVIVISKTMKSQLLEKYPEIPGNKIKVIYNGFDPEDFDVNEPLERNDPGCLILHAGTLSSWRKTPKYFEVVKELCDENVEFSKTIKLQLMGLVFDEVRAEIDRLNLYSNIEILPHRSYDLTIRKMKSADFLLLIVGDLPKMKNALALKLFDYIGAKKPVLALAPAGETADLIKNYNLGFVANPNKKDEIRTMLETAFLNWKSGNKKFEKSFSSVRQEFDRKVLTGQLCNVLEKVNV